MTYVRATEDPRNCKELLGFAMAHMAADGSHRGLLSRICMLSTYTPPKQHGSEEGLLIRLPSHI